MVIKINGNVVSAPFLPVELPVFHMERSKAQNIILYSSGAASLIALINQFVGISEYLAWGGIIFSGILWMTGHRTQAVSQTIGTTAGYLLILHAHDFINFLKGI